MPDARGPDLNTKLKEHFKNPTSVGEMLTHKTLALINERGGANLSHEAVELEYKDQPVKLPCSVSLRMYVDSQSGPSCAAEVYDANHSLVARFLPDLANEIEEEAEAAVMTKAVSLVKRLKEAAAVAQLARETVQEAAAETESVLEAKPALASTRDYGDPIYIGGGSGLGSSWLKAIMFMALGMVFMQPDLALSLVGSAYRYSDLFRNGDQTEIMKAVMPLVNICRQIMGFMLVIMGMFESFKASKGF